MIHLKIDCPKSTDLLLMKGGESPLNSPPLLDKYVRNYYSPAPLKRQE